MVFRSGVSSAPAPDHSALCHTCQSFDDWYSRGEALANQQEFQQALRCFEEAAILMPDNLSAVLYQAVCLIHLDQPQRALGLTEILLAQDPNHSQGWLFRGVALHRLGQYKAAYASYDKAVGKTPQVGLMDRLRYWLKHLVPHLSV